VGTSNFDTSEKQRTPSWTDRILYHSNPLHSTDPTWIKSISYKSVNDLTTSDHKPIYNIFCCKVRKVNHAALADITVNVLRELDRFENESLPVIEIVEGGQGINFGTIIGMRACTRELLIENKGKVLI